MGQHCDEHAENTAAINKHAGMWKVLFAFAGILVVFCSFMYNGQRNIEKSVANVDKTFTAYIAVNTEKINVINDRIAQVEERADDHELRIRAIEQDN